MRRSLIGSLVVTVGVLSAACGGGGKSGGTASSTTEIGVTTTTQAGPTSTASGKPTTTSRKSQSAQDSIKNLAFVAGDFPAGWTASAPDASSDEDDAALAACAGSSGPEANIASLDSQQFEKDQDQVSSETVVVRDSATYSKDVAALRSPKFSACLEDLLKKEAEKEAQGASASVDVTNLDVPSHGDFSLGRRVTVKLTSNGQTLELFADFAAYGKKRIELSAMFFGFGRPVDTTLRNSLIAKLGGRLDAAAPPG